MTALKDLLAKVEAGLDTAHDHARAFPSESAYGHCTWHDSHKASGGSVDSAKALHDAVLPGWGLGCMADAPNTIAGWHVRLVTRNAIARSVNAYDQPNPARAWLIAILRALIAQEEGA